MTLFSSHSPTAILSPCRRYRYVLTRIWSDAPPVCWIGVNPSTADANVDDPTIRKMCGFARAWSAGGIVVCNLFALRSTDPKALYADPADAIGPQNDDYIAEATKGRRVIAAWGVHGKLAGRGKAVMRMLADAGVALECLRVTKDGHPYHPLYCPASLTPIPFGPLARNT